MSQLSLDNAPSVDSYLEGRANRRSYSDMLAERMTAEHKRAISEGWEFFHDGKFGRAVERFEAAESADRNDPEAAIGIICSAAADKSGHLAHTVLRRSVDPNSISHKPGLFDVEINLYNKHADPEFVTRIVNRFGRSARQMADSEDLAAISAFLFWFSGQRDAALRQADRIYEAHRTSPFGAMAAQMRGENAPRRDDVFNHSVSESFPHGLRPAENGF